VYLEQTQPLIAFYQERGLLREVDGRMPIEQVTANLLEILPASSEHLQKVE